MGMCALIPTLPSLCLFSSCSSDEAPYDLRVRTYFPKVADFERDEKGDPIMASRRGPERIEARQQLARERLVAAAEVSLEREGRGERNGDGPAARSSLLLVIVLLCPAGQDPSRQAEVVLLQGGREPPRELQGPRQAAEREDPSALLQRARCAQPRVVETRLKDDDDDGRNGRGATMMRLPLSSAETHKRSEMLRKRGRAGRACALTQEHARRGEGSAAGRACFPQGPGPGTYREMREVQRQAGEPLLLSSPLVSSNL